MTLRLLPNDWDDTTYSGTNSTSNSGITGVIRNKLRPLEGNVTLVFLALMWFSFAIQLILPPTLEQTVFHFTTFDPLDAWTWITSIFAHGGFGHIVMNSIVIYFFGQLAERKLGSVRFGMFFIATGAIAGMFQVGALLLLGQPGGVIGASGAGLAIMGLLTAWNPNLRVYLYFVIPIPIWLITVGFVFVSAFSIIGGGVGAGGVAQVAHFVGVVIGYAIGKVYSQPLPSDMGFDLGGNNQTMR